MNNTRRTSFSERTLRPLTTGGVRQSIFTLISSALGGGILCIPYMMFLGGWMFGIIMLTVAGLLAYYSMKVLFLCSNKTGIYSYGALLSHATSPIAGPLLDIVIVLYGSGVVIAYYVFLGDFVPSLAEALGWSWLRDRTTCQIICCILAIPFGFPRKLSALQYMAPISTIALILTAIVALVRIPRMASALTPEEAQLEIGIVSPNLLKCFTLCLFSYICHMNVVSVAGELIHPTISRASKIALRSALTQLVFYIVIGISGYISFGQTVHQNFITNYPSDDHLIVVCRFLLTLTIFFALPINTNPTANAFVHFLLTTGLFPESLTGVGAIEQDMERPLVAEGDRRLYVTGGSTLTPPGPADQTTPLMIEVEPLKYVRIGGAVFVLVQGMVVAIFVPGIADVISILGGSFGTIIMLVCPVIIYFRVFRAEVASERKAKVLVGFLTTASVVSAAAVVCTVLRIV